VSQLTKAKQVSLKKYEDTKASLEEEVHARTKLQGELRSAQDEANLLKTQLEDDEKSREDLERQLSKVS